jgi:DNA-damage-inducible protein D
VELEYASYAIGLDKIRHSTAEGAEYWLARDLLPLLDYSDWRSFQSVIEKAKVACGSAGSKAENHFVETPRMVAIGSGAQRETDDWYLSRYACLLIAMNAEGSKPQVAHAMTYFAIQTRRQELQDQIAETEKRLQVRLRLMDDNHRLAGAAKKAGVTRYPIFQDAGHRGLYGMALSDVKSHKGLTPSQDLLDHVGRLELSAHEFRANVTQERLNRDEVKTEQRAIETHRTVGQEIRKVMMRDNGVKPEDLPTAPSIASLVRKQRKKIRAAKTPWTH